MDIVYLVKKTQQGDETAYIELFQKHEEMVYRMAFVYVKNLEDALDIVQETAYRSFKSIGSLRQPKYFVTWLTKIAINCSINLLKQRSKIIQFEPSKFDSFYTENEDISLSLTLNDLLENLDATEKSIILLRFYQDYTIKDVSEILELPLGTTKTILYRTSDKLRGILKEVSS